MHQQRMLMISYTVLVMEHRHRGMAQGMGTYLALAQNIYLSRIS